MDGENATQTDDSNRRPEQPFNSLPRWAMRLAFPLVALAVVLGLRAMNDPEHATAWWIGATAALVAALVMLRLRRRST